jgi:cysteine desulfurase
VERGQSPAPAAFVSPVGCMHSIYLDSSASTPVLAPVWEAMRPYFTDTFGNPASSHHGGRLARRALEDARESTAALLGAHPDEVIFTSGATEANNLAIFGLAEGVPALIACSQLEHPCVLEPIRQLQLRGCTLHALPVESSGTIAFGAIDELVGKQVGVVALMLANHETGAVQPVQAAAARLGSDWALHCDAAAAAGKMPVQFHDLGAATLTISAHKFHGPKGIGALLIRRGIKLGPRLFGGHQQRSRRPGTEPVALAVGLAAALQLATAEREQRRLRVEELRCIFLDLLEQQAQPLWINGQASGGLPHVLNLSFPGCQADLLLMNLDLAGVCCSTGSACSSGSLLPSPVLQAMALPGERLRSAMRFSFSHRLTNEEAATAAQRVANVVKFLRTPLTS